MELSLSKFPWWGQIAAFVVVSAGAVFAFWHFYVKDVQADIEARQARLTTLRADINRGLATARRLPEFQSQVADLQNRLENLRAVLPEQKDVADILRRVQGLATQSNLTLQRFKPQAPKQETLYAALPHDLMVEGTYHNLGIFFDRISKFPRIINVSNLAVKPRAPQEANATITAEFVATTFVLQEGAKGTAAGGRPVPKQPSAPK